MRKEEGEKRRRSDNSRNSKTVASRSAGGVRRKGKRSGKECRKNKRKREKKEWSQTGGRGVGGQKRIGDVSSVEKGKGVGKKLTSGEGIIKKGPNADRKGGRSRFHQRARDDAGKEGMVKQKNVGPVSVGWDRLEGNGGPGRKDCSRRIHEIGSFD